MRQPLIDPYGVALDQVNQILFITDGTSKRIYMMNPAVPQISQILYLSSTAIDSGEVFILLLILLLLLYCYYYIIINILCFFNICLFTCLLLII